MKSFNFKNGNKVPALGFGTWQLTEEECVDAVTKALEIGYRHIDTADKYGNHKEVGKAIKNSGVKRGDIFLTTKVWHSELSSDNLRKSVKKSLEELQTDYLDLLLIHWPNRNIPLEESLKAMDQLKKEDVIKNIGVSNFTINHLKDCLNIGVEVVNNQVEIHPTFSQFELQKFAEDNGILLTAYSPLGRGSDLEIPELKEIASNHGKTVSQVILNWLIKRGIIVIPKATSEKHIRDNFNIFDFELNPAEIEQIKKLNKDSRRGNPDWAEFDY